MYVRQTCVCTYEGLLAYVLSFEATYVCICTYVFIVTGRSVKVARTVDFTMFLQRNVGMYARDMYVFC